MTTAAERRRADLRAQQRADILAGFAASLADKGYAANTIADLAAAAQVSKTTLYEHFTGKEEMYLALHRSIADDVLAKMAAVLEQRVALAGWQDGVRKMVSTYFDTIAAEPTYLATLFTEATAASPTTRHAREDAVDRFAAVIVTMTSSLASEFPEVNPLTHPLAVAFLGGVNELTYRAASAGATAVRALQDTAADLMLRLLLSQSP